VIAADPAGQQRLALRRRRGSELAAPVGSRASNWIPAFRREKVKNPA
jgi:hypothetical protein